MIDEKYQGKKYRTRDGREAKIIASDLIGKYPIVAIVARDDGTQYPIHLTSDFRAHISGPEAPIDLFEVTPWDGLKPGMLCMVSSDRLYWYPRIFGKYNPVKDFPFSSLTTLDEGSDAFEWKYCRPLTEEEWKIVRGE